MNDAMNDAENEASLRAPTSKKERRRVNRQLREEAQNSVKRSSRTKKLLAGGGALLIAAVVLAVVVVWARRQDATLPGQFLQGTGNRAHIALGSSHESYSNPPTSGPHYVSPVKAGVYDVPVADEYLVHNMEHGHVIIWYHCHGALPAVSFFGNVFMAEAHEVEMPSSSPSGAGVGERLRAGCKNEVETLKTMVADEFSSWKVVLVPRENLDTRFALTAWERLDTFDDFDAERVRRFVKAFRDKGPEATAE